MGHYSARKRVERRRYRSKYKKSFDTFKEKSDYFLSILETSFEYIEANDTFVSEFFKRNMDVILYHTVFKIECVCNLGNTIQNNCKSLNQDSNLETRNENKINLADVNEKHDSSHLKNKKSLDDSNKKRDENFNIQFNQNKTDIGSVEFKNTKVDLNINNNQDRTVESMNNRENNEIVTVKNKKDTNKEKHVKILKNKYADKQKEKLSEDNNSKNRYLIDDNTSSSSSFKEYDFDNIKYYKTLKRQNVQCNKLDFNHLGLFLKVISSNNIILEETIKRYIHHFGLMLVQISNIEKCKYFYDLSLIFTGILKSYKYENEFINSTFANALIGLLKYPPYLELFYVLLPKTRFADYCKCKKNFITSIIKQMNQQIADTGSCSELAELLYKLLMNSIPGIFKDSIWDHSDLCKDIFSEATEFIRMFFETKETYGIIRMHEITSIIIKNTVFKDGSKNITREFIKFFDMNLGEKIFYTKLKGFTLEKQFEILKLGNCVKKNTNSKENVLDNIRNKDILNEKNKNFTNECAGEVLNNKITIKSNNYIDTNTNTKIQIKDNKNDTNNIKSYKICENHNINDKVREDLIFKYGVIKTDKNEMKNTSMNICQPCYKNKNSENNNVVNNNDQNHCNMKSKSYLENLDYNNNDIKCFDYSKNTNDQIINNYADDRTSKKIGETSLKNYVFKYERKNTDFNKYVFSIKEINTLSLLAELFVVENPNLIDWFEDSYLYKSLIHILFLKEEFTFMQQLITKIIINIFNLYKYTKHLLIIKIIDEIEPGLIFYGREYHAREFGKSPKIPSLNTFCVILFKEILNIIRKPFIKKSDIFKYDKEINNWPRQIKTINLKKKSVIELNKKKDDPLSIEKNDQNLIQNILNKHIKNLMTGEHIIDLLFYYEKQIIRELIEEDDDLKFFLEMYFSESQIRFIFYKTLENFPICDAFL